MDVDKPLDELVAANKKARGSKRGRGGRANVGVRGAAAGGARAKYAGAVPAQKGQAPSLSPKKQNSYPMATKIMISKLPADVTVPQIRDLFNSTIGKTTSISLNHNDKGRSTGQATVEFSKPEHATQAMQQFNGRMIDQKPLKIEIIVDPTMRSLSDRFGPPPPAASTSTATRSTARRGRGRGGKAAAGGSTRPPKAEPKTAEDLDAEMEQWMQKPE